MKESLLDKVASLAGKENIAMPEVIEKGVSNPRIDPGVMNFIMLASIVSQEVGIRKILHKQEFAGEVVSIILPVTEQTQSYELIAKWPFHPLITASFHNYGPNTAYLFLNREGSWIPLHDGDNFKADFAFADKRLEGIQYKCDPGNTASVTVIGKY